MAIYTTKVVLLLSNATITCFLGLTICTYSMVGRTLLIIDDFYISILSSNNILVLLRLRKDISRTISILVSAIKNIS